MRVHCLDGYCGKQVPVVDSILHRRMRTLAKQLRCKPPCEPRVEMMKEILPVDMEEGKSSFGFYGVYSIATGARFLTTTV